MQLRFIVTHCQFNDARGPGPKQWTVILRPVDARIQVNIDIAVYASEQVALGTEYVMLPADQLTVVG